MIVLVRAVRTLCILVQAQHVVSRRLEPDDIHNMGVEGAAAIVWCVGHGAVQARASWCPPGDIVRSHRVVAGVVKRVVDAGPDVDVRRRVLWGGN